MYPTSAMPCKRVERTLSSRVRRIARAAGILVVELEITLDSPNHKIQITVVVRIHKSGGTVDPTSAMSAMSSNGLSAPSLLSNPDGHKSGLPQILVGMPQSFISLLPPHTPAQSNCAAPPHTPAQSNCAPSSLQLSAEAPPSKKRVTARPRIACIACIVRTKGVRVSSLHGTLVI